LLRSNARAIYKRANTVAEWAAVFAAVIGGLSLITLFMNRPIKDKGRGFERYVMWDLWKSETDLYDQSTSKIDLKAEPKDKISFSEVIKHGSSVDEEWEGKGSDQSTKKKEENRQVTAVESLSLE